MITPDILIAAGYREFKDSLSLADRCFQKRVMSDIWCDDDHKTRFFINLYQYNHHWELNMSFTRDDPRFPYCWLKFQVSKSTSVDDIMLMAMETFARNKGVPYDSEE